MQVDNVAVGGAGIESCERVSSLAVTGEWWPRRHVCAAVPWTGPRSFQSH